MNDLTGSFAFFLKEIIENFREKSDNFHIYRELVKQEISKKNSLIAFYLPPLSSLSLSLLPSFIETLTAYKSTYFVLRTVYIYTNPPLYQEFVLNKLCVLTKI